MKKENNTNKHTKIRRSVIDKILFCLLAVASVIIFIWDIVKDFIPEQYWQLKFLVIVVGALAGFTSIFKMAKKIYGQNGESDREHAEKTK